MDAVRIANVAYKTLGYPEDEDRMDIQHFIKMLLFINKLKIGKHKIIEVMGAYEMIYKGDRRCD